MENPGTVPPQPDVTDDDRLWALLGWIFTPLVPIVMLLLEDKKARPFIRYNNVQALVFGLVNVVVVPVLAPLLGIGCLVGLAIFVYQIYLAIQAYNGEWVNIPFVTDFVKEQGWI